MKPYATTSHDLPCHGITYHIMTCNVVPPFPPLTSSLLSLHPDVPVHPPRRLVSRPSFPPPPPPPRQFLSIHFCKKYAVPSRPKLDLSTRRNADEFIKRKSRQPSARNRRERRCVTIIMTKLLEQFSITLSVRREGIGECRRQSCASEGRGWDGLPRHPKNTCHINKSINVWKKIKSILFCKRCISLTSLCATVPSRSENHATHRSRSRRR